MALLRMIPRWLSGYWEDPVDYKYKGRLAKIPISSFRDNANPPSEKFSMRIRRLLSFLLLVSMVWARSTPLGVRASQFSQNSDPAVNAQKMLAKMTPDERVGQLFLVSFTGATAGQDSQIFDLISQYHVGGVVLESGNDNFVAAPDTTSAAYNLISDLQSAEWQASQGGPAAMQTGTPTLQPVPTPVPPNYIPLFIGISQDGDGYPSDQILAGLTPLPDLMAIGATWNTGLAEQVGAIAGKELSSLGFNLIFGPSLDVLEFSRLNPWKWFGGERIWWRSILGGCNGECLHHWIAHRW